MKVLVTGGAGYVGSNLISELIKVKNIEITSLDNYFSGSKDNHHESKKVKYIEGSTWDIDKFFPKNDFDIIFHFGEYSRIVYSFEDIEYVNKSISFGTSKVLDFAVQNNSKFIYSASSSKFGNRGNDKNLSPYAFSKSVNVDLIKNYHEWFNLNYEIIYFFNVYGKNHIREGKYATVIAIFEEQFKQNIPLTVVKPGTQTRDFTHIDDIVSGILKIFKLELNKEWHLRSGKNVSILEIADMFNSKYKLIDERRGERFTSEEFYSDSNSILGWKPKLNINKYIEHFIKNHK